MKIILNGHELILKEFQSLAEGSAGSAVFSVVKASPLWKDFDVTVRFRHMCDSTIYDIAGAAEGKEYPLPYEVLRAGTVYVSATGINPEGKIATTNIVCFTVDESLGGGITPTVTLDAYAQYVKLVNEERLLSQEARQKTEEFLSAAEECLKKAASYAAAAEGAGSISDGYRLRCEELYYETASLKEQYVQNEASRILQEAQRNYAEAQRAAAEQLRQSEEAARRQEELLRKAAELERQTAELERKEACEYAIGSKADKLTSFKAGNLLICDRFGNIADGGILLRICPGGGIQAVFDD